MSTAQDLPLAYGEPAAAPSLRLVPQQPLDFDEAVRRVRPRLHRYAARRLGDLHEAEELVQEALLRAYSHRDQLLTEEDLSAWSTVVTGRLVIDRLRVRGRSTSVADVPENARMGRDTADIVVGRDEARTALDALDAMPARQASLLWAREVEGHSYEELCRRFEMSEPAVRSVLTRARKSLRKEYASRGGTLPVGGLSVLAPWVAGLNWADRLRSAVTRLTAPTTLATIGVTTLGGLILSPIGQAPATATFSPAQAIVVGSVQDRGQDALHGATAGTTAAAPRTRAAAPTAVTTAPRTGLRRLVYQPLAPVQEIPCTESPGLLHAPDAPGLPTGALGAGGSTCQESSTRLSVSAPGAQTTGYGDYGLESSDLDCTALAAVTALPASPLRCTPEETTQP